MRAVYQDDSCSTIAETYYDIVENLPYGLKYDGPNSEDFIDLKQTVDGGYIAFGREGIRLSPLNYNGNVLLVKYNADKTVSWTKSLGGTGEDLPKEIILTEDNNILVLGTIKSMDGNIFGNHGGQDIFLVKYDLSGNLLWQKTIGTDTYEEAVSLKELPGGDLIVVGSSYKDFVTISRLGKTGNTKWQKGYSDLDLFPFYGSIISTEIDNDGIVLFSNAKSVQKYGLNKIDLNGNYLWSKKISTGNGSDNMRKVLKDSSNNYYVVGQKNIHDPALPTTSKALLVKTDSAGNILMEKQYGGTLNNSFEDIKVLDNGDLLLIGYTNSNDGDVAGNENQWGQWVVRTNPAGEIIWQKCLTFGYSNILADQNTLILANKGNAGLIAGSLDLNSGLLKWTKTYARNDSSNADDYVNALKKDSDGNILIVGYSRGDWDRNGLILKINKDTGAPMN